MAKKKNIPEPTQLEKKLRRKYNDFMADHAGEIHEYVIKRQKAAVAHDEIAVIGVDLHYEKIRERVANALQWKEAADQMYRARMKGRHAVPQHQWWAYLIDEELAEEKEREDQGKEKPLIFVSGGI